MRLLKAFGLAAIAAAALLAFVGAGSASATTLCIEKEEPCKSPLPSGTVLEGETEEAGVFEMGEFKTKCNSTFAGKTTSAGGKEKAVTAEITSIKYSSCTGACSAVKALNLAYAASIKWTSGSAGKITVEKGSGGGEPRLELTCQLQPPVVVACVYGIAVETWSVESGHPGHTVKTQTRFLVSGPLSCASEMKESWRYRVTSPMWLFINP